MGSSMPHPELRIFSALYRNGPSPATRSACRSFCAPALGNKPNIVTIDAEIPTSANGVLYKLGANSGGLTCFVEDGVLCYEYNLFIIQRTKIRAKQKLPIGKVKIEVETAYAVLRPGGPLNITMKVNGEVVATGQVPISAPLLFTANDCLDIGIALGSPVSLDYYDKAPFKFNGTIEQVAREVRATAKPELAIGHRLFRIPSAGQRCEKLTFRSERAVMIGGGSHGEKREASFLGDRQRGFREQQIYASRSSAAEANSPEASCTER